MGLLAAHLAAPPGRGVLCTESRRPTVATNRPALLGRWITPWAMSILRARFTVERDNPVATIISTTWSAAYFPPYLYWVQTIVKRTGHTDVGRSLSVHSDTATASGIHVPGPFFRLGWHGAATWVLIFSAWISIPLSPARLPATGSTWACHPRPRTGPGRR